MMREVTPQDCYTIGRVVCLWSWKTPPPKCTTVLLLVRSLSIPVGSCIHTAARTSIDIRLGNVLYNVQRYDLEVLVLAYWLLVLMLIM